jgi:hypothetical protein
VQVESDHLSIGSLLVSRTMAAWVPCDGEPCSVQVYAIVRIKKDSVTPAFFREAWCL